MDANLGRRFPSPTHPPTERHPPTPKARRNPPRLITYANEPRPLFDRFQQRPMGSRRIRCHIVINLDPEFRSKRNERKHHSISRPNSIEINRIAPPPPPPPPPPPVFFKNFTATKSRRHMAANAQSPWFFFLFFFYIYFCGTFCGTFLLCVELGLRACACVSLVVATQRGRRPQSPAHRRCGRSSAVAPPTHPPSTATPPSPPPQPRPLPPTQKPAFKNQKKKPTDRSWKTKTHKRKRGGRKCVFFVFFFLVFFCLLVCLVFLGGR